MSFEFKEKGDGIVSFVIKRFVHLDKREREKERDIEIDIVHIEIDIY